MKAVIVDDEASVRNTIRSILNENFPEVDVVAMSGSVAEAYEHLSKLKPGLLFLDIELPDGTGFDLLKKLDPVTFKVIFVTGHQEYALSAIKVSALDYIMKPVDADELRMAVGKALSVISNEEIQLKMQALNENMQGKKTLRRIILHTADHLQLVSVNDIIRAEADSNYTSFFLAGGKKIMVSRTIKEFDSMLSSSGMIRVHQSHLVNVNHIDRFVKKDGGWLILKNGSKIPVSPNLKKQVLKALTEHLYD
ncbi:MAG: response regulator transcription factor [Bacteroidales bacterium]|nr:response regulator transcription factor [Bacteroidales bacterium]MBN2634427.1 response regulator transcription factor [Bacteroidales bacterium]